MSKTGYVYIVTNKVRSVLYTGVTSRLKQRAWEHRTGEMPGFASRYRATLLVYYEVCDDMISAITREKQIKNYSRLKKMQLISRFNPQWRDLYDEL